MVYPHILNSVIIPELLQQVGTLYNVQPLPVVNKHSYSIQYVLLL